MYPGHDGGESVVWAVTNAEDINDLFPTSPSNPKPPTQASEQEPWLAHAEGRACRRSREAIAQLGGIARLGGARTAKTRLRTPCFHQACLFQKIPCRGRSGRGPNERLGCGMIGSRGGSGGDWTREGGNVKVQRGKRERKKGRKKGRKKERIRRYRPPLNLSSLEIK